MLYPAHFGFRRRTIANDLIGDVLADAVVDGIPLQNASQKWREPISPDER
jgi:hypothetical protein